jgi:hypothetical protein
MKDTYTYFYDASKITQTMFSLWLGKGGGKIIFGGYDESLKVHASLPIEWHPMRIYPPLSIDVYSITVNDINMANTPQLAFFDSGSSYAHFSGYALRELNDIIYESCQTSGTCLGTRVTKSCYSKASGDTLADYFASFPSIKITFNNQIYMKWFPSEYLYEHNSTTYCLAAVEHSKDYMVIGAAMMRQTMIIFDMSIQSVAMVRWYILTYSLQKLTQK